MDFSMQEQQLLDQALVAIGQKPMPSDHVTALVQAFGAPEIVRICRAAQNRNDGERLFHLSRVARAHAVCRTQLRMPYATIERLDAARQSDSIRFTSVFSDAVAGDVNAIAVIKGWLAPAADTTQQPARTAPPIHATTVGPPPARPSNQPSQPQQAQPAQRLPQREAVAVGRASPAGNGSNNVRSLPQPQSQSAPVPVQPTSDTDRGTRSFDQIVVYGRDKVGGTALQFENSPTRDRKSATINLSLARAKGQKTTDGVAWDQKIMIMLEPKEVQKILSVLLGHLPSTRHAGHGSANDKWLEVSESTDPQWAGTVYVTIAQGKGDKADIRRCGVSSDDIGDVIAILNRVLMIQLPSITAVTTSEILIRVADLATKAMAAKQLRDGATQNQRQPARAGARG